MTQKSAVLAVGLFLALPACTPAPSPEKIELAKRIDKAIGTYGTQLEDGLLQVGYRAPFSAAPDIYRAGLRKALEAHHLEIVALEDDLATLQASRHSEGYMRAVLAYWESPLGRAFEAKQRAARETSMATGNAKAEPALTPQEQAAYKQFQTLAASEPGPSPAEYLERMAPLGDKIRRETFLYYCDHGGSCPAPLLERLTADERKAKQQP